MPQQNDPFAQYAKQPTTDSDPFAQYAVQPTTDQQTTTEDTSLFGRLGGWRGLGATGIRGIAGILGAEGMAPGAAISGAGETLAEMLEKRTIDPSQVDPKRVAIEAGLGAFPLHVLAPAGKLAASFIRSGAHAGVGEAAREAFSDQPIDPTRIATSTGLGGILGAGASKLGDVLGARKASRPISAELESSAYKGQTPPTVGYSPSTSPEALALQQAIKDAQAATPEATTQGIPVTGTAAPAPYRASAKAADAAEKAEKVTKEAAEAQKLAQAKIAQGQSGEGSWKLGTPSTTYSAGPPGAKTRVTERWVLKDPDAAMDTGAKDIADKIGPDYDKTAAQVREDVAAGKYPADIQTGDPFAQYRDTPTPQTGVEAPIAGQETVSPELRTPQEAPAPSAGPEPELVQPSKPSVRGGPGPEGMKALNEFMYGPSGKPFDEGAIDVPYTVEKSEASPLAQLFKGRVAGPGERVPEGTVIPPRVEAAGPHYDALQELFKSGQATPEEAAGARVAGQALSREAREAGLPTRSQATAKGAKPISEVQTAVGGPESPGPSGEGVASDWATREADIAQTAQQSPEAFAGIQREVNNLIQQGTPTEPGKFDALRRTLTGGEAGELKLPFTQQQAQAALKTGGGAVAGGALGTLLGPADEDKPYDNIKNAIAGAVIGGVIAGASNNKEAVQNLLNWRNANWLSGSLQLRKPIFDLASSAIYALEHAVDNPALLGRITKEFANLPENIKQYTAAFKDPKIAMDVLGEGASTLAQEDPGAWMGAVRKPLAGMQNLTVNALRRAGVPDENIEDILKLGTPKTGTGRGWVALQGNPYVRFLRPFARFATNMAEGGLQRIPGISLFPREPGAAMGTIFGGDPKTALTRQLFGTTAIGLGALQGMGEAQEQEETGKAIPKPQYLEALAGPYLPNVAMGRAFANPRALRELVNMYAPQAGTSMIGTGPKTTLGQVPGEMYKILRDQLVWDIPGITYDPDESPARKTGTGGR